jgi:hypothetical protein
MIGIIYGLVSLRYFSELIHIMSRGKEGNMPRAKPLCPFTDKFCTSCKALFTSAPGEKSVSKLRGCQLVEKAASK